MLIFVEKFLNDKILTLIDLNDYEKDFKRIYLRNVVDCNHRLRLNE